MTALPSAPWTISSYGLARSRILVVSNSDIAWSLSVCQYYCQQRGIPLANIIEVPGGTDAIQQGTSPDYAVSPDWFDGIIYPIAEALETNQYSAVILGPRFPESFTLRAFDANGNVLEGDLGSVLHATFSIVPFIAHAIEVKAARVEGAAIGRNYEPLADSFLMQSVDGVMTQLTPATYPRYIEYGAFGHLLPSGTTDSMWYNTDPWEIIPWPSAAQYVERYSISSVPVGVGYLGWPEGFHGPAIDPAPSAQTEAGVIALIDRATAAMKAATPLNREQPHLIVLYDMTSNGWPLTDQQRIVAKLIEWGVNVQYIYWTDADPGDGDGGPSDPPYSGAVCTKAEFLAGLGTPLDYFLITGALNNGVLASGVPANDANLNPLTHSHARLSGMSYPYSHNVLAVSDGVAVAGLIDTQHQGGHANWYTMGSLLNLLQGQSYIEAACWQRAQEESIWNTPIGDPLYAPYGLPRFQMTGSVEDV